uniref:ANK_REP_REGION domain-containing protein n=1 Tax=Macrostomum lignano TaxID=282301 RepID=A0A1I8GU69_9PLAT
CTSGSATACQSAIRGDFDEVRRLATSGLVKARDELNRTIIMLTADTDWTPPQTGKCIEYFLNLGAEPQAVELSSGDTAAHMAARRDHLRVLALLPFRAKWQVNESSRTPLMEAAKSGCWRCAKHLLHLLRQAKFVQVSRGGRGGGRYGSRGRVELLKMQDESGRTAQDLATDSGHFELARIIERERRLVVSFNGAGSIKGLSSTEMECATSPLEQLIESSNWSGLLEDANRVNCDLPDRDGWTPAMRAFKSAACPTAVLQRLADLADVSCSNVWGVSCLHRAASAGAPPSSLAILLDLGAPVNAVDEDNRTPLMLLATTGMTTAEATLAARSLLSGGADWDNSSSCLAQVTPLRLAVEARNHELVALLLPYQHKKFFEESLKMNCCRDSLRCLAAELLGRQRAWQLTAAGRLPAVLIEFVSQHVAGCFGCGVCLDDESDS